MILAPFFGCFLVMYLVLRVAAAANSRWPSWLRVALVAVVCFALIQLSIWMIPEPAVLFAWLAGSAAATIGLPEPGLRAITLALGRARLPLYLLSVLTLAALIYLFVPITTFLTSPGELSIHLDYLLSTNARDAMMLVYLAAALYALMMIERIRTALTLLALGSLVLALVYSYLLPFGYPMMSGLAFEQIPIPALAQVPRVLGDVAVVALVAWLVRAGLLRYGGRNFLVGVLIADLSLCAAAGVDLIRERNGEAGGPQASDQLAARPLRFSRTQPNVLIIFLDRFMGSYIESITHSDPDLGARLDGFTWYARSVSAGENSIAGVHSMLGGYDYLPVAMDARNLPLRDVSVEAFSILPYNFAHKGYLVDIVNPKGLGFTMDGDCRFLAIDGVNCTHIPKAISRRVAQQTGFPINDLAKSSYTQLLVLLGAMRGAPYSTKEILLNRGPWQKFLDHSAGTTFREWAELNAWSELSDTDAPKSAMNFISNILPHESYYMGEDCRPQRERFSVPPEEVTRRGHVSLFSLQHSIGARCALLAVANYLDFLKRSGVYDNTRIIIVSDHGIVGPVEDHSTRATAGGTQGDDYVRTRSVLLVKPRNAHGPLQVSEQFMPNSEVPRIACEEIGGCVNPFLANKPIQALGREDPFYVSIVPWQFNLQNPSSYVIDEQWALVGKDPYAASGWKVLKGREFTR